MVASMHCGKSKQGNRLPTHPALQLHQFNPLEALPLVRGLGPEYVAPVTQLLIRKVSQLGLYYSGIQAWGQPFAIDLGDLFEAYVGRHLATMDGAAVYPAIPYEENKAKKESVDWIAVFEDVTLLVEVKSRRPTEAVRAATPDAGDALQLSLGKAFRQIDNTASLVRHRHPAFGAVPSDRPMVSLVVTMEPFHVVNAPMYRDQLLTNPSLEIRVCSSHELESLVTISDTTELVPRS